MALGPIIDLFERKNDLPVTFWSWIWQKALVVLVCGFRDASVKKAVKARCAMAAKELQYQGRREVLFGLFMDK